MKPKRWAALGPALVLTALAGAPLCSAYAQAEGAGSAAAKPGPGSADAQRFEQARAPHVKNAGERLQALPAAQSCVQLAAGNARLSDCHRHEQEISRLPRAPGA